MKSLQELIAITIELTGQRAATRSLPATLGTLLLASGGWLLAQSPPASAPDPGGALDLLPHIRSLVPGENGSLRLEAMVPANQLYALRSSTDLVRWRRVAGLSTTDSANPVAEFDAPTNKHGFYRLARRGYHVSLPSTAYRYL